MYELAFGTIYTGLMTNFLLIVATSPLVVMLVTTNPQTSWPALVILSPLLAPALVAAFSTFRELSSQGSVPVVRTFWRSWWRQLRRSLVVGAALAVIGTIAGLNLVFLMSTERLGAVLVPVQVVLFAIALTTGMLTLTALPEVPEARLTLVVRNAVLLSVRQPHLTLPSLVVLALLASLIAAHPAIALGIAAAPLLFAVWGACRYALRPMLPAATAATT
jgi:uncharacterized membrane protein YesL